MHSLIEFIIQNMLQDVINKQIKTYQYVFVIINDKFLTLGIPLIVIEMFIMSFVHELVTTAINQKTCLHVSALCM